jgi:ABC-2 type transport system ATP-binding protein
VTDAIAIQATALERRYGSTLALRKLNLGIPSGRVVALVGPNGAGKTTLLRLCSGLDDPTSGHIEVLGWSPQRQPMMVLPRIGFVAQDRPLYRRFSVKDLLELGGRLNPRWDAGLARSRLKRVKIPLDRRADQLSGGQKAQLALALVLAKKPDLLLLDEPVAGLDPLARREFLQELMDAVASHQLSVVLSSHIVSELERTCDYLVILADGELQVAGEIDAILNQHSILVGPRAEDGIEKDPTVIRWSHSERQTTLLVRTDGRSAGQGWEHHEASLEDIVLAYLGRPESRSLPRPEMAPDPMATN